MLADARSRLERLMPAEALAAQRQGATIIDIRPRENRELEGAIPGALVMPGPELEELAASGVDPRNHQASQGQPVIVVCNEGTRSAITAAGLLEHGVPEATDVIGGFRAWRARGLPVTVPATDSGAAVPGQERVMA
jgi:rhodanese-related sulfurtransferase